MNKITLKDISENILISTIKDRIITVAGFCLIAGVDCQIDVEQSFSYCTNPQIREEKLFSKKWVDITTDNSGKINDSFRQLGAFFSQKFERGVRIKAKIDEFNLILNTSQFIVERNKDIEEKHETIALQFIKYDEVQEYIKAKRAITSSILVNEYRGIYDLYVSIRSKHPFFKTIIEKILERKEYYSTVLYVSKYGIYYTPYDPWNDAYSNRDFDFEYDCAKKLYFDEFGMSPLPDDNYKYAIVFNILNAFLQSKYKDDYTISITSPKFTFCLTSIQKPEATVLEEW